MNSADSIKELEMSIEQAKQLVRMGEALDRLHNNPDFKNIILKEYLTEEPVRLVHVKADANMQSAESQQAILKQMDAIGSLANFFRTVRYHAEMSRKAIADSEELRNELLSEEVENG